MEENILLINRINELWYDLEEEYDQKHQETTDVEKEILSEKVNKIVKNEKKPLKILDLGTGTGFLPSLIKLRKQDKFYCSDISEKMLMIAERKLQKNNYFFVKVSEGKAYPFTDEYFDMITCSATLHHILNYKILLNECDRLLKKGGYFLCGIEPNKRFYDSWFSYQERFFDFFMDNPLRVIYAIMSKIKLNVLLEKAYSKTKRYKKLYKKKEDKINNHLLKEGIIKKRLNIWDIRHLVEVHSRKGIDYREIFPKMETIYFETFFHLGHLSISHNKNNLILNYGEFLKRKFPNKGMGFLIIKRKG